jgi:hypothetical protein
MNEPTQRFEHALLTAIDGMVVGPRYKLTFSPESRVAEDVGARFSPM